MKKPEYYWWHGRDLKAFFAEACAAGLENVRIEFHPDEGMLHIRPEKRPGEVAAESHSSGHNFVHVCPPDCD